MVNSITQTFGNSVNSLIDGTLSITKKSMPKGFIARSVIWTTTEALGAFVFEEILYASLNSYHTLAENYLPYYKYLPLVSIGLLSLLAARTSKAAFFIVFTSVLLFFTFYDKEELERSASKITGIVIYFLGGMFASILGGFFGLRLTHSQVNFTNYRPRMLEHSCAGQIFETCITPATTPIFTPLRLISKIFFQMLVYNRKELYHAFKLSARKGPGIGIIGPALTQMLYARFQEIDSKSISEDMLKGLKPFFSDKGTSFFSANVLDRVLSAKVRELQDNSSFIVNILLRSLIQYYFFNDKNTTSLPAAINLVGSSVIWNEKNLTDATNFITQSLNSFGVFLLGKRVYPSSHIEFIESTIKSHLKSFLCFTLARGLDPSISREPLNEKEELQILSIVHNILFSVLLRPLLPRKLSTPAQNTIQSVIAFGACAIHRLQGIKPKATLTDRTAIGAPINSYFAPPPNKIEDDYEIVSPD